MDAKDLQEEGQAIHHVLSAFHNYSKHTYYTLIEPKRQRYETLLVQDKALLSSWFPQYIQDLEQAVKDNQKFFDDMVEQVSSAWGVDLQQIGGFIETSLADYDKVRKTLKQCYREWSSESKQERDFAFGRTIEHLTEKFPDKLTRSKCQVLIPGCGLGRQNFELIKEGFQVQGNEFDYFVILISSFMINARLSVNSYQIHPFIHDSSNQLSRASQLRSVSIPDIDQIEQLTNLQKELGTSVDVMDLMSITTGSFVDLYGPNDKTILYSDSKFTKQGRTFRLENKGKFDFIITNFFIDTSTNLIEYLRTLNHCLKTDDGAWINFGPLQWHFEHSMETMEVTDEFGIKNDITLGGLEFSKEDTVTLVRNWFDFNLRETGLKTVYAGDLNNGGVYTFDCDYWIARKKRQRPAQVNR